MTSCENCKELGEQLAKSYDIIKRWENLYSKRQDEMGDLKAKIEIEKKKNMRLVDAIQQKKRQDNPN